MRHRNCILFRQRIGPRWSRPLRWLLPLLGLSGNALAQGIVVERLAPRVSSGGYLTTEGPETSGHLRIGASFFTSYAKAPLIAVMGPEKRTLIDHMVTAQASASLGLLRFLEVGLAVPATLYQGGEGLAAPSALGDLRAFGKVRLLSSTHLGLGLLGTFSFPTGNNEAFAGSGQVAFAPRAMVEGRVRFLRAGLNLGVLLRQQGSLAEFTTSHQLDFSLGVGIRPIQHLELFGELYGATALTAPFSDRNHTPLEALGAAAVHLGDFALFGGVGAGLLEGYGAPLVRTFVSLRYQQRPKAEPKVVEPRTLVVVEPPTPPPEPPPRVLASREVTVAPPHRQEETTEWKDELRIEVSTTELIPNQAIFFELNRAKVRPEFSPILDALAALIKERTDLGVIRIEGHTDASGSTEFNQALSQRRAHAVRDALIGKGVEPRRLQTLGYGADRPIADNAKEAIRWQNRRVIFYHQSASRVQERPPPKKLPDPD